MKWKKTIANLYNNYMSDSNKIAYDSNEDNRYDIEHFNFLASTTTM